MAAVGGAVLTACLAVSGASAAIWPAFRAPRVALARRAAPAPGPDPDLVSAELRAAQLLARIALPPGAAPQTSDPSTGGVLSDQGPATGGQLVDQAGYWTVPASPAAVQAYVEHHRPAGSRFGSTASSSGPGGGVWTESFCFPGVPGQLAGETLAVTVAAAGDGDAAVRGDGEALWRPTWEQVPPATRRASVRVDDGPAVALTGTRLAALVRLADRAQAAPPGVLSCPFGAGETVGVAFLSGPGAPLARLSIGVGGCGFFGFSVGDRQGPGLSGAAQIIALLWSLGGLTRCRAGDLRAVAGSVMRAGGSRWMTSPSPMRPGRRARSRVRPRCRCATSGARRCRSSRAGRAARSRRRSPNLGSR